MSIHIEELYFNYGQRVALADITMNVEAGSIVGLLGNNGAGKSTLFRILCGLLAPQRGKVSVNDFELPRDRARARAAIGYVAQKFGLYEDLTVEENLSFYARAYGLEKRVAKERIAEMLDRFELAPRRRQIAGALSQGWKQRLAFAAALSHRPSVLLLDEVTAGLDPAARQYAWQVIQSEADRGSTVVFSTHHAEEADRCHTKIWLEEGRMVPDAFGRRAA